MLRFVLLATHMREGSSFALDTLGRLESSMSRGGKQSLLSSVGAKTRTLASPNALSCPWLHERCTWIERIDLEMDVTRGGLAIRSCRLSSSSTGLESKATSMRG